MGLEREREREKGKEREQSRGGHRGGQKNDTATSNLHYRVNKNGSIFRKIATHFTLAAKEQQFGVLWLVTSAECDTN